MNEAISGGQGGEDPFDWSRVKTEKQSHDDSIRRAAEMLDQEMGDIKEAVHDLVATPGDVTLITSQAVVERLQLLTDTLAELLGLFCGHLASGDLDDEAKAIGISGGELSRKTAAGPTDEYTTDPGDRLLEFPIGSRVRFDAGWGRPGVDGRAGTVVAFLDRPYSRGHYRVRWDDGGEEEGIPAKCLELT